MGVYIKSMKMPDNCDNCDFMEVKGKYGEPYCELGVFIECPTRRPPDCPLVPVPPHGDLIDLKAPFKAQYYDEMTEEWIEKMVKVEDALYSCMVDEMPPTIIPATEGET